MIVEEIKNIKSGKKELRQFGLTVGIVFALLAALLWWRGRSSCPYFFLISAVLILPAFLVPSVLKPVHKVWMTFAILMSWVMTRVILGLVFYVGITPMGFLARLSGKDFLRLKFDKKADSYWIPKERQKFEKSDYERQF
ncbi:MAG: SxtJ family membrane protein [Candidatus Eisenbacteria bacterium]|nr:SxtJ family membrane protein [Candidatus Eisenbacteria bacterium]